MSEIPRMRGQLGPVKKPLKMPKKEKHWAESALQVTDTATGEPMPSTPDKPPNDGNTVMIHLPGAEDIEQAPNRRKGCQSRTLTLKKRLGHNNDRAFEEQFYNKVGPPASYLVERMHSKPYDWFSILTSEHRRNAVQVDHEKRTVHFLQTGEVIGYGAKFLRQLFQTKPGPDNFQSLMDKFCSGEFLERVMGPKNSYGWRFDAHSGTHLLPEYFSTTLMNIAARDSIGYYNQFFRPKEPKRASQHVVAISLLELVELPTDYGRYLSDEIASAPQTLKKIEMYWGLLGSLLFDQHRNI